MTCGKCGEKPRKGCGAFPKAVIEIDNPEQITLMRKVVIPASMGDDTTVPPVIGKYHNVLLNYEANNKSYLYSSDGIPTLLTGACTCHKNLVVHLPNGMTTYENNDAPILISEVSEAFKRGQSVFLVDDAPGHSDSVYTVTAVDMDDGIYSMRADQTGINARIHDGYWHISGDGDVWDSVEFIQDTAPYPYRIPDVSASTATWQAFGPRVGEVYFPASEDVTFTHPAGGATSVASLWEKLDSGEEIRLRIPLQAISDASVSLVEEGYFNVNPMREITVELGPQHYYDYDNGASGQDNYKVQGYMIESTSYVPFGGMVGPEDFLVGIVKVTQGGTSHYIFVTSLRQDRFI